jgi:hypothetical protein
VELAGQGQSEPGAFRFLVRGALLPELLEDGGLIFRGDADAGVRDRHLGYIAVQTSAHVDMAAFGGELQGIGQRPKVQRVSTCWSTPSSAPQEQHTQR